MSLDNPFGGLAWGHLFDSFLPDFVLSFTFFTAVIYAMLGKRLGSQRPAIAASAALGFALSVGLVWWEQQAGLSIRSLGPWAVGFAVIMLAGVMYQAIRQTGGSWAGAGIALGASLLVGWILGMRWPGADQILQTLITVTLVVGVVAFLLHQKTLMPVSEPQWAQPKAVRHDRDDLRGEKSLANQLGQGLRKTRQAADDLQEHPQEAENVMLQLRRMLPAEGWLTQRLSVGVHTITLESGMASEYYNFGVGYMNTGLRHRPRAD
jgi:hypothetical protein